MTGTEEVSDSHTVSLSDFTTSTKTGMSFSATVSGMEPRPSPTPGKARTYVPQRISAERVVVNGKLESAELKLTGPGIKADGELTLMLQTERWGTTYAARSVRLIPQEIWRVVPAWVKSAMEEIGKRELEVDE